MLLDALSDYGWHMPFVHVLVVASRLHALAAFNEKVLLLQCAFWARLIFTSYLGVSSANHTCRRLMVSDVEDSR